MGERVTTEPTCNRCRWAKKLRAPSRYVGQDGVPLGIGVYTGPWPGTEINGQHFNAIGGHFCEHFDRPRGLVLDTYRCRDFAWPDTVDNQAAISDAKVIEIAP